MKLMSGTIGVAIVSAGLVLATGCAVDQNGHVVFNPNAPIFRPPSVVINNSTDNYQIQRIRQRAGQGDAIAQCILGTYYANGRGVAQNYWEAVKWYRLSADQGNAPAQYHLGVCYASGRGVAKNYWEAVKWYRLSAEQGYALAQNNLGVCYATGRGVAQDYAEAVKWYRKAADQGNLAAQNNLRRYSVNEGVVVKAPEPNNPTTQNPPSAEPIDSTAQNQFTVDDIKAASNAGTKPDFLISTINESNSKFSAQDIAAAQQANPPIDPSVIDCMKSHSN
jgi:TPR repeat protein